MSPVDFFGSGSADCCASTLQPVNSSRLDSRRKLSVAEAISLDLSSDVGPPKPTQVGGPVVSDKFH